jgi:hypothetical protein
VGAARSTGLPGGARPSAGQRAEGVRGNRGRPIKLRSTAPSRRLPPVETDREETLARSGARRGSPRAVARRRGGIREDAEVPEAPEMVSDRRLAPGNVGLVRVRSYVAGVGAVVFGVPGREK